MSQIIRLPAALRAITNDQDLVEVNVTSIRQAFAELLTRYPEIQDRLLDEAGNIRRFVNVFVNEEDIRFLQQEETPLKDGDEVSIIPAIAGG